MIGRNDRNVMSVIRNHCARTRCCCRNVVFLWSQFTSYGPAHAQFGPIQFKLSREPSPDSILSPSNLNSCSKRLCTWLTIPIPSLAVWVSWDGELRGVLCAEFGPTAGVGEIQLGGKEDMWATVVPEASLGHPFSRKSCAFTSGKKENTKNVKI